MTEGADNQKTAVCPECGLLTAHDANYCEHCGSEMRPNNGVSSVAGELAEEGGRNSKTLVIGPEQRRKIAEIGKRETSDVPLLHIVAFKTDIGHSHHVNQDAGGAWSGIRSDGTPVSVIVVADGVSAGKHSEAASQLTVEVIQTRMVPLLVDPTADVDVLLAALVETARDANIRVAQRPHQSLSSADATTLVASVCVGTEGAGVWCGDSRVYQLSQDSIAQLTRDHSWAEGVVSHGIMTREDAARDPRAHMITRWLGPPEQDDPGFETFRFSLKTGDLVMCCTDGLYMYYAPPVSDDAEIARVVNSHLPDVQGGIDDLIGIALERGGRDNITAAVIYVDIRELDETAQTEKLPSLSSSVEKTTRLPIPVPDDTQ